MPAPGKIISLVFDDLRGCIHNIFRLLFKLPRRGSISHSFMIKDIPNMIVVRRKSIFSLYTRIYKSDNILVSTVRDSVHFNFSNVFDIWKRILF